jgi:hypothetical protein
VGDYRLLDRAAVDVINRLGESARFNKGLFAWVGFRVATVDYVRSQRHAGETNGAGAGFEPGARRDYGSTTAPLRIWTYVGGVTALGAFAMRPFWCCTR